MGEEVERVQNGYKEEKIYFVVKTKGTNIYELRSDERIKIKSAEKRYGVTKDAKFVGPVKDYDILQRNGEVKSPWIK